MDGIKTGETKVPSGSWGNIGGRFGETLGDFFELSEEQMTYLRLFFYHNRLRKNVMNK